MRTGAAMESRGVVLVRSTAVLPLVALMLLAGFAGCSSEDTKPPPPAEKKPVLDPTVSAKIDEAIAMLNNTNREDRWLKQLIAAAETDELARRAGIDRTASALRQSWANPGGGQGFLKPEGRARAIRALDRFGGDDPVAMDVFKQGAKSGDSEVAGASAAARASRGDTGSFNSLVSSIKASKGDRAAQDRSAAALVKIVKAEQRDAVLAAIDAGSRDAFAPVVSAVLPAEPEPRVQALAAIVKGHANPNARICALEELRKAKDPEIVDFARSQANQDDADLRTYARKLLAAQDPKVAALQFESVLELETRDPDGAGKILSTIDSPETIRVACDTLANTSRAPACRAACARQVLSRVRDEKAPAALRDPAARERGLGVLRRSINDPNEEVARAAIEALGIAGDESDAESLALLVGRSPAQASAAVTALGRIGGPAAAEKLVAVLESDAKLRDACRDALVGMKGLKKISFDLGVQLIGHLLAPDVAVRKSALVVLRAIKTDADIFDYNADADMSARSRSVEKWIAWWREKSARGG